MNIKSTIFFVVVIFLAFLIGCVNLSKKTQQVPSSQVTYEIVSTKSGYGYKIYVDGNLYISQPNIPAMSGMAGFVNEQEARKIAELAVSKIKQGIVPPTITTEEIMACGITLNVSQP